MQDKNVQTLKGFRDFLPPEKKARDFVKAKITEVFELYGFEPIETPTLEYASLLLGKYGEEADKLVYSFKDRGDREIALRYDQTVPTSRILYQYQNELPKYFRRYQIQNVFRADKPQKGRYREFTQCDCDIFATKSTIADAELLAVYYSVYKSLGINSIKLVINDRQTLIDTLSPFAQSANVEVLSVIQTIDKLDKLSSDEVITELVKKGFSQEAASKTLSAIKSAKMSANLEEIVKNTIALGVEESAIEFRPTLARGLDYYTGMIFEGVIPEYLVGSVGGGGRYDNLIGQLSGKDISATGFAIGFDRTVEAVQQLNLLPKEATNSAQILVTIFDQNSLEKTLGIASKLRSNNLKVEVYPELDKLGKQFKLANQKNIPFVIVVGESEIQQNKVQLKNMQTGDQELLTVDEVIKKLK
ncbi:histidine--tRNA ligase [Candidatus Woesebacteria bacterium]|nr:histidine--tRNA ligase [Candidatus Woesebacteria bacterium]